MGTALPGGEAGNLPENRGLRSSEGGCGATGSLIVDRASKLVIISGCQSPLSVVFTSIFIGTDVVCS